MNFEVTTLVYQYVEVCMYVSVGAIFAGMPFSYIAKRYDWHGAFLFMELLLIGMLIINFVTRNLHFKFIPIKKKMQ